jgi:NAD dependent epimerase/dehydratase family enzyme
MIVAWKKILVQSRHSITQIWEFLKRKKKQISGMLLFQLVAVGYYEIECM